MGRSFPTSSPCNGFVDPGWQWCTVDYDGWCHPRYAFLYPAVPLNLGLTLLDFSVCFDGIPFSLEQRFSSNCNVDMLDPIWVVRMLLSPN